MLRTAFNLGRKCTPPKVLIVPYFPMVAEAHVRQGFLTDEQYEKLRDALPDLSEAAIPGRLLYRRSTRRTACDPLGPGGLGTGLRHAEFSRY